MSLWSVVKRWPHAVGVGLDILGSALFGGAPYETISARLGRSYGRCVLCRRLCSILNLVLGRDHCQESWEIYKRINQSTGDST